MRHLKTAMILAGSLILTTLLSLAGCGGDHGDRYRGDRDRDSVQVDRHDSDRHDDRGADTPRDRGEHSDR